MPRPLPAAFDGEHWWVEAAGREVRLSNLEKVFWPAEGYTKGDLVAYYFNVVRDHPAVPAGPAPDHEADARRHRGAVLLREERTERTRRTGSRAARSTRTTRRQLIDYLMVEDDRRRCCTWRTSGASSSIPSTRDAARSSIPTTCSSTWTRWTPPFEDVLAVAQHVKVALDRLGCPATRSSPARPACRSTCRSSPGTRTSRRATFVGAVGRFINKADPQRVTMEWEVKKRTGKVFIDHNMNRSGANIAAVYSVRPEPGASVSTPVTWDEVEEGRSGPGTSRSLRSTSAWPRWATCSATCSTSRWTSTPRSRRWASRSRSATARPVGSSAPTRGSRQPKRRRRTVAPTAGRSKDDETIARSKDPKLREYLSMRDFVETPEPAGGDASAGGRRVRHPEAQRDAAALRPAPGDATA